MDNEAYCFIDNIRVVLSGDASNEYICKFSSHLVITKELLACRVLWILSSAVHHYLQSLKSCPAFVALT